MSVWWSSLKTAGSWLAVGGSGPGRAWLSHSGCCVLPAVVAAAEPCPPPEHLAALCQCRAPCRVPCPSPCGLRGADGAELLHSRFCCRTPAPLRLWKGLQDPGVPRRPQYILGAARGSRWLGCGRRPFQTFLVAVEKPLVDNASCAVSQPQAQGNGPRLHSWNFSGATDECRQCEGAAQLQAKWAREVTLEKQGRQENEKGWTIHHICSPPYTPHTSLSAEKGIQSTNSRYSETRRCLYEPSFSVLFPH